MAEESHQAHQEESCDSGTIDRPGDVARLLSGNPSRVRASGFDSRFPHLEFPTPTTSTPPSLELGRVSVLMRVQLDNFGIEIAERNAGTHGTW